MAWHMITYDDILVQVEHVIGLPVAPSPIFGMGSILPFDPMRMMHQFSMHQQGIPQNIPPSGVQVPQPTFGQFQSIFAIVPPQQLMTPQQHQQVFVLLACEYFKIINLYNSEGQFDRLNFGWKNSSQQFSMFLLAYSKQSSIFASTPTFTSPVISIETTVTS